jgi:dTDP-4-dehydrorhamnose reductase
MTVLVTGGAGYIGSHMVHALVDAGESVVVIDNLSTGSSAFLPEGVPLFIGDAGDENLVEGVIAQHNVESIIHFAGSVAVPDSMRDPLGYYRNNTMTTRSLLNAAVNGGVNRFIFSSTAAVYGNPEQVPVAEHAPTRPRSPYGSSKLMTGGKAVPRARWARPAGGIGLKIKPLERDPENGTRVFRKHYAQPGKLARDDAFEEASSRSNCLKNALIAGKESFA